MFYINNMTIKKVLGNWKNISQQKGSTFAPLKNDWYIKVTFLYTLESVKYILAVSLTLQKSANSFAHFSEVEMCSGSSS